MSTTPNVENSECFPFAHKSPGLYSQNGNGYPRQYRISRGWVCVCPKVRLWRERKWYEAKYRKAAVCQALVYHSLSLHLKSVVFRIPDILNSQKVIFEELCRASGSPWLDVWSKDMHLQRGKKNDPTPTHSEKGRNGPIKSILYRLRLHNCYDYSNLVTPFKVCSPGSASAIAEIHWFPFSKKRIFRKFTSRCRRAQPEYFRRAISRQNYKEMIGWRMGSKVNLTSYSSLRGFIWWVLK